MTREDKELLLKDLCARLPYRVKAPVMGHNNPLQILGISKLHKSTWAWQKGTYVVSFWNDTKCIDSVKPYLRPISSMTEEEKEIYKCFSINYGDGNNIMTPNPMAIDFLLQKHFDYRGLIEKGLAIAVTEENNPYI